MKRLDMILICPQRARFVNESTKTNISGCVPNTSPAYEALILPDLLTRKCAPERFSAWKLSWYLRRLPQRKRVEEINLRLFKIGSKLGHDLYPMDKLNSFRPLHQSQAA